MNRKGFMVIEIFIVASILTLFGVFFAVNQGSDQYVQGDNVCECIEPSDQGR